MSTNLDLYPEEKIYLDMPVEWYDFGDGSFIASSSPGTSIERDSVVALFFSGKSQFHYQVFEGDFTKEELPSMFKRYAPEFAAYVKLREAEEDE